MGKLTKGQQRELDILEFFVPSKVTWGEKNDEDIQKFFAWSERGVPLDIIPQQDRTYLGRLYWAKSRRDYQSKEWFKDMGRYIFLKELEDDLPLVVYQWFCKSFGFKI